MRTSRQFAKFGGAALALVAALVFGGGVSGAEVVKSPNDPREYDAFVLANGIKVIVISDPATDKAAASLDVNIGSASDPKDHPGLAHFLEHLLFLGTEKYPESAEYKEFISSHGGTDNAYTALEHTNYYFDIEKGHLEPALDRFAQFFVAPLFTASYVDRERQVVHSEYQSKLQEDGWRVRTVQKLISNPEHPFSGFNVGSAETLADPAGGSIRDVLISFYQQHYSANVMTLAVLGQEPLEQLKQWATEKFSAVPDRQSKPHEIAAPLFAADTLPLRLEIVPLKDDRRLSLSFPIPPLRQHYRSQPMRYIGGLLGHEGEGSLLSLLKQRGWADSLWAGPLADHSSDAVYTVSVELTRAGLEQQDAVVEHIFQFLRLIEQSGIDRWRFDELARLADIDFRFVEGSSAIGLARALAASLHDYPPEDILRASYMMTDFSPELIQGYLDYLNPQNALLTISAPELQTDAVEPWFQTPYRSSKIAADTLAAWREAPIDRRLGLAQPNEFIPDHLVLQPAATATAKPELIRLAPGLEFWHQQDDTFRVPRAEFYFTVRSPVANDTPQHAMLTQLFIKLSNDLLTEYTYPAYLAGLQYSLYKHMRGFTVRISGYDEKQNALLGRILETIGNPVVDDERFAVLKDELARDLGNSKQEPPYRQAYGEVMNLLITPYWNEQQSLDALQPLTADDLRQFIPELTRRVSIGALAYGNVDRAGALAMAQNLQSRLLADAQPMEVPHGRLLKLDGGDRYARQLEVGTGDSVLLVYYQGSHNNEVGRAEFALLGQMLESPFFDDLRTENKLGYIVFASPLPLLQVPGLAFAVQSPSADPAELEQHVTRFINGYRESLQDLSDVAFIRHKQALLSRILQKDKTLQERASRYWTEIDRKLHEFDSQQRLARAVKALTKKDLIAAYEQQLLSPKRRRLVVRSVGNGHAEQFLARTKDPREALIADPGTFKQGREAFPSRTGS